MSGRREMHVGIIGAGVMAEAMIAGLLADRAVSGERLIASCHHRIGPPYRRQLRGLGWVPRVNTIGFRARGPRLRVAVATGLASLTLAALTPALAPAAAAPSTDAVPKAECGPGSHLKPAVSPFP